MQYPAFPQPGLSTWAGHSLPNILLKMLKTFALVPYQGWSILSPPPSVPVPVPKAFLLNHSQFSPLINRNCLISGLAELEFFLDPRLSFLASVAGQEPDVGQPVMPKCSSSGSSNPRQGSAGAFPDTEKRDGPQCCQQCPLERLDLPKTCCPLARGAKQSLTQEVSWIMSRERLLKPVPLSWAFPAGSYWMFSLFRAGFGVIPAGFRTSPMAEGSSLSFPQADSLGMSPCHTWGKGAAGLCWGSGCGGAAPAI